MDIDEQLIRAADKAAEDQDKSRNQFFAESVENMLLQLERERIDDAFAEMATDSQYQAELESLEKELSPASDAAWIRVDAREKTTQRSGAKKVTKRSHRAAR